MPDDQPPEIRIAPTSLLHALGPSRVREVIALGRPVAYERNELIFRTGSSGDSLYIVARGAVRVSTLSAGGDEVVIAVLGAGEVLGELSVLDGQPRSATASAAEHTELVVIGRDSFLTWVNDTHDACSALLKTLAARVRSTSEALTDLALLDLGQRLAKRLLVVAESSGSDTIRISQEELGRLVGATREAVNKHLGEFEDAGWIERGRMRITLVDTAALERASG